ncbi:MAG: DUF2817 domain-containing protein [archaeon]|nr:DUF2817 domain-containing protein [archaeon]
MYSDFVAQLEKICSTKNFKLIQISKTGKQKEFPLFKIIINPKAKQSICFSAGIHGDEYSGPFGVLKFLKEFKNKNKKLKIIIFPCANPFGFEFKKRNNFNNSNLNRKFSEKNLADERKPLFDSLKKENLQFFLSFHEDDELNGCYLYAYAKTVNDLNVFQAILSITKKHASLQLSKKIYKHKANQALIHNPKADGSFEQRMFKEGILSACFEVPDKLSLKKMNKINAEAMKTVVSFFSKN